jgi:hypothetical protein
MIILVLHIVSVQSTSGFDEAASSEHCWQVAYTVEKHKPVSQKTEEAEQTAFVGQGKHATCPLFIWKVPSLHGVHAD